MKHLLTAFVSASAAATMACGPYFQPSYLRESSPYAVRLRQEAAIRRFVANVSDLIPEPGKFGVGTSTLQAERLDFTEALKKAFPRMAEKERDELIGKYVAYVTDWRKNFPNHTAPRPEVPEELAEFMLYIEGFQTLREECPDHVPPAWEKLLALPPERRHYRTVWVHFMLGNHFKKELHRRYDDCRDAVRAGFADTPGLALRSYALEIRFGSDPVRIIRRAAEAEKCNSGKEFLGRVHCLIGLEEGEYLRLLDDPLCREYLALVDPSPRFRQLVKGLKLRNADICAYRAWQAGNVREAQEFLDSLEKPTLLSLYIGAKIDRHRGNIPGAVKKLRQWLKLAGSAVPVPEKDLLYAHDYELAVSAPLDDEVYGVLGNAMVMRRDFTEAAEFFFRAGQYTDLFAVAEKFMTPDDLVKFTDRVIEAGGKLKPRIPGDEGWRNDPDFNRRYIAAHLPHLTARRAFREGDYDTAKRYMPAEYRDLVDRYRQFIARGADGSLSGDQRALALYNAAKIMRIRGMELAGTESAPDFYPGNYNCDGFAAIPGTTPGNCAKCRYEPGTGLWQFCEEHAQFFRDDVPGLLAVKTCDTVPRHRRFHYRYRAAELALRAGALAEDADLRALIYLFGGSCIKLDSPPEADIFYKKLVLECRGSRLSGIADELRWFPSFTMDIEPINSLEEVKKTVAAIPGGESAGKEKNL